MKNPYNFYLAASAIPAVLYGLFTMSLMYPIIILVLQLVLTPIIFSPFFSNEIDSNYPPGVRQATGNVIMGIFLIIIISVLKSKGYIN
tara:strand:- start:306 stop:569 length:264 start_codon:yes stop_codon:yes gene_type:complete